jgi:hypothetical protein
VERFERDDDDDGGAGWWSGECGGCHGGESSFREKGRMLVAYEGNLAS